MWDIAAAFQMAGKAIASFFDYKGKKLDAEPRKRQEAQIDQIRKERDEDIRAGDDWASKP